MPNFNDFVIAFFGIFTHKQFRSDDFLTYLQKPRRTGDEASVVDNTLISPLLGLLGFSQGEQVYNQNNKNGRPDFAPTLTDAGVCFVVENKSTALELTLDPDDPESHLAQLLGYLRSLGLRAGWLCNGKRLMVWRMDNPQTPTCALDFSIADAVAEWENGGAESLSPANRNGLLLLWESFQKATFADWQRVEQTLAVDLPDWEVQALPIGNHPANQELLVGAVKNLLHDLQAEALRFLEAHLSRFDIYARRNALIDDNDGLDAESEINQKRARVLGSLKTIAPLVGLDEEETDGIKNALLALKSSPHAFRNTTELLDSVRTTLNTARARKFAASEKTVKAWAKFDNELGPLGDSLREYGNTLFAFHQRQAILRHDNRDAIALRENYDLWKSLVQETMLSGMSEAEQQSEFALQATYVTFIRLLLIRVCEDKGILPFRFLSNGGLKHWQEDMERYFLFATGNPYNTLLDMAFQNAQNIYAHFFTGRELFNWYTMDRLRFVRVLQQLSRFNFADVDSDIIGTIYNTYVERKEKKKKGQYYTPPEIVRYILDEAGYLAPASIIGANKRLIDPACGSGTFLVEAARRLIAAYKHRGTSTPRAILSSLRENIYGFDLNPFACYLAEVNLLIQSLDLVKLAIAENTPPKPPQLQRFHIYNVDALSPASGILYYARANTLMAEELDVVDLIKDRKDGYEAGFAFVVANPPYGAGLSESYKAFLRLWWPDVFRGKPDTYVFFFALALKLLGANGKLGFITPNTYLMGTNTDKLRNELLQVGRITQIVDLPQGLWADANVDCVLLFLSRDASAASRTTQQIAINSMDVRDTLEKLTARQWKETLTQSQAVWTSDGDKEMNIRWSPLLQKIEDACLVFDETDKKQKVQRLGDVTDSTQGISPYATASESASNPYIKSRRDVPLNAPEWKPLLDGDSYVGRYELRWAKHQPFLKYGNWLERSRDPKFYELPKLLVINAMNKRSRRRLVATYDEQNFYSRKNFHSIISDNQDYDVKFLLALFNSSLLNYWYAQHYDNVNINPEYFRQLPIFPADATTQAAFAALVDDLLTQHATLNTLRGEQGYVIRTKRNGDTEILPPYDRLLNAAQAQYPDFAAVSLWDAQAIGLVHLPDECDPDAQISRVFITPRYPESLVLRRNELWLHVPDPDRRRFLLHYLALPQWKGRSFNEIGGAAWVPETPEALAAFFAREAKETSEIAARLAAIAATDEEIDRRVLDLYHITDSVERAKILGSAPAAEADAEEAAAAEGNAIETLENREEDSETADSVEEA